MAYKISPDTARGVLAALKANEDHAGAAAHDTRIGLTAIEPYTDRRGERILACLNRLARISSIELGSSWRDALAEIAQSDS